MIEKLFAASITFGVALLIICAFNPTDCGGSIIWALMLIGIPLLIILITYLIPTKWLEDEIKQK